MTVIESPKYRNTTIRFRSYDISFNGEGKATVDEHVANAIFEAKFPNIYEEGKVPRKKTKFEEALEQSNDENAKAYQAEVARLNSIIDTYKKNEQKLKEEIAAWKKVVDDLQKAPGTATQEPAVTATEEETVTEERGVAEEVVVEEKPVEDELLVELRAKKKDELLDIANSLGIETSASIKKDDLISIIMSNTK